jgi:hypothetical protein
VALSSCRRIDARVIDAAFTKFRSRTNESVPDGAKSARRN